MSYRGRLLETELRKPTSRGKVRLLLGARQVGKSSLLRALLPDGAVAINLQDPRQRQRFERSAGVLSGELEAVPGKRITVCIDEIQKVPALLDDVQYLQDRHPGKFEFFLTGSSARRLRADANLLAGRVHTYRMFPVIQSEREDKGTSILGPVAVTPTSPAFPATTIENLLVWGSLPGVSLEARAKRNATLSAYAEVYLEEEIRREAVVRDTGAFARFLALAAIESGGVMNLTGLSQESGIPVATIRNYYQILVDTFVGYWIPAYGKAGRKQILSTPRFVFFDTGVRNAAAMLPLEASLLRTQAGTLFEQWVLVELLHRCAYLGRTHRVSFWKTKGGAEVDAVIETPKEDIPVEVKWTENPGSGDARHLESFLNTFSSRARRGYVVCRVPRARKLSERVTAIPWSEL
jgi:uncharacterized protein